MLIFCSHVEEKKNVIQNDFKKVGGGIWPRMVYSKISVTTTSQLRWVHFLKNKNALLYLKKNCSLYTVLTYK